MIVYNCLSGELCLGTVPARCQGPVRGAAKATDTDQTSIMSGKRLCDHCRFHKYVTVTPTDWIWTGTFYTQFGQPTYGQTWLDGTRMGAHRASYILHVGPVPDGLDILHSCDATKACVNWNHLRPGTHQENIREAFDKLPPDKFSGENNGRARLNWDIAHAIRAAVASGETQASQGIVYGVAAAHISQIIRGLKWPESRCPIHGAVSAEVAA
jgi:hypothetical protein